MGVKTEEKKEKKVGCECRVSKTGEEIAVRVTGREQRRIP